MNSSIAIATGAPLAQDFSDAHKGPDLEQKKRLLKIKIKANIDLFLGYLNRYQTEDQINTAAVEKDIREKFEQFLIGCEFYGAFDDFKKLLKQKSEKKNNKYRSDGTINWYHELGPIVNTLALVRAGRAGGGMDLEDMDEEGGLEVDIATKLGHDRIEDTAITRVGFAREQLRRARGFFKNLYATQPEEATPERRQFEYKKAHLTARNVIQMTKKVVIIGKDGKPERFPDGKLKRESLFRNTKLYVYNLFAGKDANPVSFTTKQADVSANLATLTFSQKHTPQKRLDFCNAYEDICGSRAWVIHQAPKKWPNYANVIEFWDNTMGANLYLEFFCLEHLHPEVYKNDKNKHEHGDPIVPSGLIGYLDKFLHIPVPRAFSTFHVAMDRKRKLAQTSPEACYYLQQGIYPALESHKEHFPEIFGEQPGAVRAQPYTAGSLAVGMPLATSPCN